MRRYTYRERERAQGRKRGKELREGGREAYTHRDIENHGDREKEKEKSVQQTKIKHAQIRSFGNCMWFPERCDRIPQWRWLGGKSLLFWRPCGQDGWRDLRLWFFLGCWTWRAHDSHWCYNRLAAECGNCSKLFQIVSGFWYVEQKPRQCQLSKPGGVLVCNCLQQIKCRNGIHPSRGGSRSIQLHAAAVGAGCGVAAAFEAPFAGGYVIAAQPVASDAWWRISTKSRPQ